MAVDALDVAGITGSGVVVNILVKHWLSKRTRSKDFNEWRKERLLSLLIKLGEAFSASRASVLAMGKMFMQNLMDIKAIEHRLGE